MTGQAADSFVRGIASATVGVLYPEESPFFDELIAGPPGAPAGASGDSPLGFGLNEAVQVFTPLVWAAATALAGALATEAGNAVKAELGARLRTGLKRVLDPKQPAQTVVLTEAQLARVHQKALQQLAAFGVDNATAARIADALVGSVVVGD